MPWLWKEDEVPQSRINMGWSWREWPMPGRCSTRRMLWDCKVERSPMPGRRSSFGVSMASAQRMVSCVE